MENIRVRYTRYLVNDMKRRIEKRILKKKIEKKQYAGRPVYNIDEGNALLSQAIINGQPYMVTRYGATEINLAIDALVYEKIRDDHLHTMKKCAGFFPEDKELAMQFGDCMDEASKDIDIAALYYSRGEEFFLAEYAKKAKLVHNRSIEPWYTGETPWTAFLEGKRVLIIHPFDNTIRNQYEKRKKLFPGTKILPEFELYTIKAVQTVAGATDKRFANWFEALDWMESQAQMIDYDVAILGCGAYGLPLASRLKKEGKIAIHMGGATQLLFGIKGSRWDNHPIISKLYNDAWVRPSEEDKPKSYQDVEEGCYW